MGICVSCFGGSSNHRRDSYDEPSETSRLLHQNSYDQQYGSAYNDPTGQQADPEAVKRAQDALDKICAQTLDKLIDVSQTSHLDQRSMGDYARLFAEAFPPGAVNPADELAWVRGIIQHASPGDRRWDWTKVERIKGPLVSTLEPQE